MGFVICFWYYFETIYWNKGKPFNFVLKFSDTGRCLLLRMVRIEMHSKFFRVFLVCLKNR